MPPTKEIARCLASRLVSSSNKRELYRKEVEQGVGKESGSYKQTDPDQTFKYPFKGVE